MFGFGLAEGHIHMGIVAEVNMAFGQSVRISASIPGAMPQATVIKRPSAKKHVAISWVARIFTLPLA